jgi:hypothetical protein
LFSKSPHLTFVFNAFLSIITSQLPKKPGVPFQNAAVAATATALSVEFPAYGNKAESLRLQGRERSFVSSMLFSVFRFVVILL